MGQKVIERSDNSLFSVHGELPSVMNLAQRAAADYIFRNDFAKLIFVVNVYCANVGARPDPRPWMIKNLASWRAVAPCAGAAQPPRLIPAFN
ncbi:MAG TPA: hypothetical protein VN764_06900 [Polyangiaceae bacterium]|nr:hypothetical protein [Polyangiaceae bacterium]